jgi:hypothetical protein
MSDTPSARSLLDKLGVKPEHTVAVLGIRDASFTAELKGRARRVTTGRTKGADLIFLSCEKPADLQKIAVVKPDLARDGALWVVRPKGKGATGPSEAETMRAGLDAGLVDVKVVSFSATHTAEKFVYRLKDRQRM